jgi:hypothetical protein
MADVFIGLSSQAWLVASRITNHAMLNWPDDLAILGQWHSVECVSPVLRIQVHTGAKGIGGNRA